MSSSTSTMSDSSRKRTLASFNFTSASTPSKSTTKTETKSDGKKVIEVIDLADDDEEEPLAPAASVKHESGRAASTVSPFFSSPPSSLEETPPKKMKTEAKSSLSMATPSPSVSPPPSSSLASIFSTSASSSSTSNSSSTAAYAFDKNPYWIYLPRAVPSSATCDHYYENLRSRVDPVPGVLHIYGRKCVEHRLTKGYARKAGVMNYSGTQKELSGEWPQELEELHDIAIKLLNERLAQHLLPHTGPIPVPRFKQFDTVIINYYRDGTDSISWHSDKDSIDEPIASFTFGAERTFMVKPRDKPIRPYMIKNAKAKNNKAPPAAAAAAAASSSTSSSGSNAVDAFNATSSSLPSIDIGERDLGTYSQVLANGSLMLMLPGMQERYLHSVPQRKTLTQGRVNVTFRMHHRLENIEPINVRA